MQKLTMTLSLNVDNVQLQLTNDDDVKTNLKFNLCEKYSNKFQSQFVRHPDDKLESVMEKLDESAIDLDVLFSHCIHDIVVCILYLLSLTTTILCLIALYDEKSFVPFYAMLVIFIIGAMFNIILSLIFFNEYVFMYINMLRCIKCDLVNSVVFILWMTDRMSKSLWYFILTSFPQSIIMIIVVLRNKNNIYFTFSLISSSLSTIYMLWYSFSSEISEKGSFSFIWYTTGFVMDWFEAFFIIYVSSSFLLQFYLYNALIGSWLVAFCIMYHLKWFIEIDNLSCKAVLIYVGYIVLFLVFGFMLEVFSFTSINIMYNVFKQNRIASGMDWNLLTWIVHSNNLNVFTYLNYKDKLKRLCVVNGLTMDLLDDSNNRSIRELNQIKREQKKAGIEMKRLVKEGHVQAVKHLAKDIVRMKDYETKLTQLMAETCSSSAQTDVSGGIRSRMIKQYLLDNCHNQFQNVSFKQLKHHKNNNAQKWFFDESVSKWCVISSWISVGLYVITRINKYILLPIIVALYVSNNIGVIFILIMQFLFIIIGLMIFIMMFDEIYYSFYFISGRENGWIDNRNYDAISNIRINKFLRTRIGYYYNTMSIHDLRGLLIKCNCFPTCIVNVIMLYSVSLPIEFEQLLDDEFDWLANVDDSDTLV